MESLAAVAGSLLLVAAGATLGFHSIRQIVVLQRSWAALFSCGLIIFNGVGMLRASIDEVLDAQAAPELVAEILTAVQAVPGVACVKAALRDSRTFMCAFPAIAQFERVTTSRTW